MHTPQHDTAPSGGSAGEIAVRCAERMYAADRASRELGIEISRVAPGHARATMTVTERMVNGHDLCHGGYVFLLADTAFAFACNTYDQVTVAASGDVVFVQPALRGQRLVADAAERFRRGRSGVYDVTVRTSDGAVVAEFRGSSRTLGRPILDDSDAAARADAAPGIDALDTPADAGTDLASTSDPTSGERH